MQIDGLYDFVLFFDELPVNVLDTLHNCFQCI